MSITMIGLPAKSVEQQGIRGLATEFGIIVPKGIRKLNELMVLVDAE
jgi:hypothetical protein